MRKFYVLFLMYFVYNAQIFSNVDACQAIWIEMCFQTEGQSDQHSSMRLNILAPLDGDDDCANAVALSVGGSDSGDLAGATNVVGEYTPPGITAPFASEWYSFTVPSTGQYFANISGNAVFTLLSDCSSTTSLGSVGPGCLSLAGGTTYFIQVASNTGTAGAYSIEIQEFTTQTTISIMDMSGVANDDGEICLNDTYDLSAEPGWNSYSWNTGASAQNLTNIVGINPGNITYTVTVTDANGCTASTSIMVTVHALPTPGINISETSGSSNNDGNICLGDDVTLTGTGGVSYEWSTTETTTSITDMPSISTTYTVTVTDANGCTESTSTVITVFPLPTASISLSETSGIANDDGLVCINDIFTLNASGGTAYEWDPTGATTMSISPNSNTFGVGMHTFTVTVTDVNGCTDSEEIMIEVLDLPTALNTTLRECSDPQGSTSGVFTLSEAEEEPSWPTTNSNDGNDIDDGSTNVTVTYHNSLLGAQTNSDFAPDGTYLDGTVIFARIEDNTTGCFDVAEVTLQVDETPDQNPTTLRACADGPGSTSGDFILTDAELAPGWPAGNMNTLADIDNGAVGINVTYHPTFGDAQAGTGEIFDGIYADGTVIYARIEDAVTGCFNIAEITLDVDPLPAIADTELRVCEDPAGSMSGDFTLSDAELAPDPTNSNQIADIDQGNGNVTVTYHNSQGDAENGVGALGDGNYPDNTTLYARIEDNTTGCFDIAEVLLLVNLAPDPVEIIYVEDNSPDDFEICEDEDFTLDVTIGTGNPPYMYDWTLPNNSTLTGTPIAIGAADVAVHDGVWVVTVTDVNGCTATDDITITVIPGPNNDDCGSAINIGTGFNPLPFNGNNVCATPGGPCGDPGDGESAIYFSYTVPPEGLSRLIVDAGASFVAVSESCGGGACEAGRTVVECPTPGATYYITVSSSDANEGNVSGTVIPEVDAPSITGAVFVDINANGTFDASDIPLTGASVAAFPGCDENATPITTTTGDDGTYSFQNLPFPPNQWLIMLDPNGEVDCSSVRECVTIDPCDPGSFEVFFPCPPPDCTSNPFSWDNDCESAYDMPLCDLQVIGDFPCGQNPTQLGPWAGQAHCNGVYHNTSFYGFVAGSGTYTINFQIFACAGAGVQYAIMEECSPGGPFVVCDGNANTGTVSISSDLLVPCRTYIFWIDGFSGSVCSYYAFVSGDWQNCSVPDIIDISLDTDCDPLCPSNQPITLTATGDPSGIPPIEEINNAEYTWTINGPLGTTSYVIEGPLGLTTEYAFVQEGTYEVCIQGYHPCDGFGDQYCEQYTFSVIPNEYKEFTVCTSDFPWYGTVDANGDPLIDESGNPIVDAYGNPWQWNYGITPITLSMVRSGQVQFQSNYFNECGCLYTQTIRVLEETSSMDTINIALCPDELPYMLDTLNITADLDSFIFKLDGVTSTNGCDSSLMVNARILRMGGNIRLGPCTDEGVELFFAIGGAFINQDRDSLRYTWYDINGNVILDTNADSSDIIVPKISGIYSLDIDIFKYGDSCTYNFTYNLDMGPLLPDSPSVEGPNVICETDGPVTYNIDGPLPGITYLWSVPSSASIIQDDSTDVLIVQWNGPTGGNICAVARNACGDSPPDCLPVQYIDQNNPDFSLASTICVDSLTSIVLTTTHPANTIYNWNFDGGVSSNTSGSGPGPHDVSWNSSGTKTVSLFVDESGCISDTTSYPIDVVDPLPLPSFTCDRSTIDSIIVSWQNYPGALNYVVDIISAGPTVVSGGTIVGNEFRVGGLTVGDSITFILTVELDHPCGNVSSLPITCYTQDCIPPMVSITSVSPICLDANTPTVTLSTTVNPPTPGTGRFSSPTGGIIDPIAGIFDPRVAGPGVHVINYNFTADQGNCRASAVPISIRVTAVPSSNFTVDPDTICIADAALVTYTGGAIGASYAWNFGQDVSGTYNGPGPHNVRWTSPGLKTITLVVTNNGCPSPISSQTVLVQPRLTIPDIECLEQQLDFVRFGWQPITNASGYEIYDADTGVLLTTLPANETSYIVTGLNEGDVVNIRVVAISANACPNTQNEYDCRATNCPPSILNLPMPISLCLTPSAADIPLTYTITNPPTSGVPTIRWSGPGVDTLRNVFVPQIAGVGSHVITLDYEQNTCTYSESFVITVRQTPVVSFTSPDTICISDPMTIRYTGTTGTGLMFNWNAAGANITSLGANLFNASFASPGNYTIELTTTLGGCTSEPFSRQVLVEAVPDTTELSCVESLDAITFNWDDISCSNGYDIFINNVPVGSQFSTTYLASDLIEGEKVEIRIEPNNICACPLPSSSLICEAKSCPDITIELVPDQTLVCYDGVAATLVPITLNIENESPNAQGSWSGTGLNNMGQFDPSVAGFGVHELTYTLVDQNCTFSASVEIAVVENPLINYETDIPLCYNDLTGSLGYEVVNGLAPYTVLLDNVQITQTDVDNIALGDHMLSARDANGCFSQVSFNIPGQVPLETEILGPTIVQIGNEATHLLNLPNGQNFTIDSIVWSINGTVVCNSPNCVSITQSHPLGQNAITVTVYYNSGCIVIDTYAFLVTELYETEFPNIIYTNSGALNNTFKISTSDPSLFVEKMRIYDRWGNLVFKQENFSAFTDPVGWAGDFGDGRKVEQGVYVYIFEMRSDNESKIIESGDVTVIR